MKDFFAMLFYMGVALFIVAFVAQAGVHLSVPRTLFGCFMAVHLVCVVYWDFLYSECYL